AIGGGGPSTIVAEGCGTRLGGSSSLQAHSSAPSHVGSQCRAQSGELRTENRREFHHKLSLMLAWERMPRHQGRAKLLFHEIDAFANDRRQIEREDRARARAGPPPWRGPCGPGLALSVSATFSRGHSALARRGQGCPGRPDLFAVWSNPYPKSQPWL